MNIKDMEVANFSCKSTFGDLELLDVFEEYVYPAMRNQEAKGSRNSETISYKFIDLKFQKYDKELVLTGRLVKNLNLKRQQILEGNELITDYDSMESSPSSFFVLILSNHKLLWIRELPRAPLLKDFRYAVTKMLNLQRSELVNDYIRRERENIFYSSSSMTNLERRAYGLYPSLDISVTQLGNKLAIKEKLEKFENIYSVKLKALKRNNELASEFDALAKAMSVTQEGSGAKDVVTEIKGGKTHPLNKEYITNIVQASADGNYEYVVKGEDKNGTTLKETTETVSLTAKINYVNNDVENSQNMYSKFMSLTSQIHSLPQQQFNLFDKLNEIEKNLLNKDQ